MATISGNELVGETLKRIGVDTVFFIMGGPINDALTSTMAKGILPPSSLGLIHARA